MKTHSMINIFPTPEEGERTDKAIAELKKALAEAVRPVAFAISDWMNKVIAKTK